jgi:hypothetical protein
VALAMLLPGLVALLLTGVLDWVDATQCCGPT